MSKAFTRSILGISVALVAFVFLGAWPGGVRAGSQSDGAYREMGVYEEVLKKIQSDYVVDPNINNVTSGALHGLLESLDADSSYMNPQEYKAYKELVNEGTAQIGIVVSKRFGYATVVSVLPGSPAEKQQITDGDILEAINGQSTREMSLAIIRMTLSGKPGSTVEISVVRPRKAEPDKLTVTRTVVAAPAMAEEQYENASILYLKPGILNHDRVSEIDAKLKALPKAGGKKVLLDLRDVAEGDEAEGVRLANAFLDHGTIATLEGQKVAKQTFAAESGKFFTSAPLVVLVNHGTSGPGELVAAAILDNKRGDVVGDRTFGEGAVQKTIELPDGGALILSIAKYASPSGKKIQDEAVTPNVVVASNNFDDDGGDEDQAAAANAPAKAAAPKVDDQLNKALEILKAKTA